MVERCPDKTEVPGSIPGVPTIMNTAKAWVVAVSMGYGHQRTAHSVRGLAPENRFINANDYPGIPAPDRRKWEGSKNFYEFISRFKRTPIIGNVVFSLFNKLLKIASFYPQHDLSRPDANVRHIANFIKRGWGKHFIETLKKQPLPMIATFFVPALMAEFYDYPENIYCIVPDADIARSWAPLMPHSSRIHYCAPSERVVERLKQYGIPPKHVSLTGYPLPKENIGKQDEIARSDTARRIVNLDPEGVYRREYASLIKEYLGTLPKNAGRPLTIMISIGGAGAQTEIGITVMRSLKEKLRAGEVRLFLGAGMKESVRTRFTNELTRLDMGDCRDNVCIVTGDTLETYFNRFNEALREIDILWTKPSELSFYCALGIPIVIAPPIGAQEDYNKEWLLRLGAGMSAENPLHVNEWLFDALKTGWFAEAAMQGFIEAERRGTFNIEKLVSQKISTV